MEHFHLDASLLADLDRLADRGQQRGALVTHVARVDAVVLRGYFRELDQILRRLETVGRIDQRGRDANGAGAHRGRDQLFHLLQLRRSGRTRAIAHDSNACLSRAVVRAEVERDAAALQPAEVGVDFRGGHRRAAFARDRAGHAL